MALDEMAHISGGPISPDAILEEFVSGAASLPLWMPVVITVAATNVKQAAVNVTATAGDPLIIGIVVGGANMDAENGYANKEAGDMVLVCVFGPCKCYVATTIVLGDGLVTQVTTGYGIKGTLATTHHAVFAMALMASDNDGDIIEVFVGKTGALT